MFVCWVLKTSGAVPYRRRASPIASRPVRRVQIPADFQIAKRGPAHGRGLVDLGPGQNLVPARGNHGRHAQQSHQQHEHRDQHFDQADAGALRGATRGDRL